MSKKILKRDAVNAIDRFFEKVNKTKGCWIWIACNNGRYGSFMLSGKAVPAHRVSWVIENDEIPDGLYVCHKCDNGFCVKPRHLFLGTQKDNVRDMFSKGRANSPKGERNRHAKLKPKDVIKIRKLISSGKFFDTEIGRRFNVTSSQIGYIKMGKSWSHI